MKINQRQPSPLVRVSSCRANGAGCRPEGVTLSEAVAVDVGVARKIDGRIQLFRTQHVDDVITDIAGGYKPVISELALDRQIPALDLRRLDVGHCGEIAKCNKGRRGAEAYRERVDAVVSCSRRRPWITENRIEDCGARAKRRNDRGPQMVLRVRIVISETR